MHRDGRYGSCRSLSPPICKQIDYKGCGERCQPAKLFKPSEALRDIGYVEYRSQALDIHGCHSLLRIYPFGSSPNGATAGATCASDPVASTTPRGLPARGPRSAPGSVI